MKTAFLFLVFLVAASATYLTGTGNVRGVTTGTNNFGTTKTEKIADKEFLVRNNNILRLLNHVHSLNTNPDQSAIAKEYRIETNVDKYTNTPAVKEFIKIFRTKMLPRNKIFTITNEKHREEVVSLFHVMYYAKDFETFYKTCCWARDNVNEGMFVYALTVAVIHRKDTRGMTLPPPCEVYPFLFINTETIQKAQRLKTQERVHDTKLAELNGVRQVDNTFYIKSNHTGWYTDTNEETTLTYFTEDIGLNTYYFYFHATYPFWMDGEEFGLTKDRRGELFLYTHQQILARYYMERLSNNLGEIPRFLWTKPIRTGFKSSLRHHNGLEMPSRPNDLLVNTVDNLWDLKTVKDYERRIRGSIDKGVVYTEDGRVLSLRKPEDIEKLGNIIQCNKDSPNTRYYLLGTLVAKKLLGNGDDTIDDYMTNPTVMEQYETALRDPMFYQLTQRVMRNVLRFKDTLRPYTRDEVSFTGVKIEDVTVDKLVTFFDEVDIDITNSVARKVEEVEQNREQFTIKAIHKRLNHLPFNVKLDINSDKSTEAVVRMFLGPKYDSMHRRIKMEDNRVNFFEMDMFVINLKTGRNTITRNSREFTVTRDDRTPTRELKKKITTCVNGNEECIVDVAETHVAFPDRLLLPKGKRVGMPFVVYVVITPLRDTKTYGTTDFDRTGKTTTTLTTKNRLTDMFVNKRTIDDNAFGFPLDRPIDTTTFWNTNMIMTEVTITHRTSVTSNTVTRDTDTDTTLTRDTDTTYTRDTMDTDTTDTMNMGGRMHDTDNTMYTKTDRMY